ncbi:hypothetical protein CBG57_04870 [Prevotella nigrescens]|nr:hypothetical protein CBG57_04870 [Prevotella nigrescens]
MTNIKINRKDMKSFSKKACFLPQPVLIIGTYDDNGKPDVEKMNLITFNPVSLKYLRMENSVGKELK